MRVDFDVLGVAGVRMVDPAPADVEQVSAALGARPGALEREPDLEVTFVERVRRAGPLRRLGTSDAAFDDESFVLLAGRGAERPVSVLPLDRLGNGPSAIVCERGSGVPMLGSLVGVTALGNGWVPLHASAFDFRGTGTVAAGWAGGGKTGTLLAFMAEGARFVSDDWVFVSGDGREVRGLETRLEVKAAYVDQLPALRPRLDGSLHGRRRARAMAIAGLRGALHLVPAPTRLRSAVERRARRSATPEALFGGRRVSAAELGHVLLVLSHDEPGVTVSPADPQVAAQRLAFATEHEWARLLGHYRQFRFAFPGVENPLLEDRGALLAAATAALARTPAHVVTHPSPAPLRELFDALAGVLES